MKFVSMRQIRSRVSGQQPGTELGVMPHLAPFVPLSTPRLALVALSLEHAPAVFAYASDPEISRLVAWPPHENLEASRRFVARSMVGYAEGGHYEWGLMRRTDQAFLGTCGFGDLDVARGVGEIGYVLAKPYWGQGYATEAAAAVLQFGFIQLGLRLIEAQAFPENAASLRVMAKLGLRYCETRLVTDAPTGASRPVCVCQLEREQWMGGVGGDPPRARPAPGGSWPPWRASAPAWCPSAGQRWSCPPLPPPGVGASRGACR